MKHVRALACEPPLLAQYRAANPAEEHRFAGDATATWNAFKNDQPAYAQLLEKLVQAQQGLCIYCEQRLVDSTGRLIFSDYQVEHVQAKSGADGRVLQWRNLALGCGGGTYKHHRDATRAYTSAPNTSCGQSKGDSDLPRGCDPRTFRLLLTLVEVDIDGKLSVNAAQCNQAAVAPSDVDDAIKLLNLNSERLRKARQDRRDNVSAQFVIYLSEILGVSRLNASQRQQALELFVAGRLQVDAHGHLCAFWTAERGAIGKPAESWLAANQEQFT